MAHGGGRASWPHHAIERRTFSILLHSSIPNFQEKWLAATLPPSCGRCQRRATLQTSLSPHGDRRTSGRGDITPGGIGATGYTTAAIGVRPAGRNLRPARIARDSIAVFNCAAPSLTVAWPAGEGSTWGGPRRVPLVVDGHQESRSRFLSCVNPSEVQPQG